MPEAPQNFYVTTPIYYVNARPHIGHAYTTIVADVLARRHRLLGHDTFFLTGTDEHGQKIERSARAASTDPQTFADQVSASFQSLWDRMGITYDRFIRTTDPAHIQGVQHLFRQLQERGAIYKSTYTGQYCVSDEAYVDGPPGIRCPDCGRLTETVAEENYYFKLSQYQRPLLDLIESNTLHITPDSRRNEVLSFLKGDINPLLAEARDRAMVESSQTSSSTQAVPLKVDQDALPRMKAEGRIATTDAGTAYVPGALKDLSISRTSFTWGVPVPDDPAHVIYVWLDALANYITALGYGSGDPTLFDKFWPADLHLVGKEIIRFHCVYWPAFLLALNPGSSAYPAPESSSDVILTLSEAKGKDPEGASTASSADPFPTTEPLSRSAPDPRAETPIAFDRAWAQKMLPRAITAHGWLLFEDSKMSKSRGNIVRTETILDAFGPLCPPDPSRKGTASAVAQIGIHEAASAAEVSSPAEPALASKHDQDLFATDVLRYFLLREITFGQDGTFSFDALITRYNADLANGYGNLVSRVLTLIERSFQGILRPDLAHYELRLPGTGEWDDLQIKTSACGKR